MELSGSDVSGVHGMSAGSAQKYSYPHCAGLGRSLIATDGSNCGLNTTVFSFTLLQNSCVSLLRSMWWSVRFAHRTLRGTSVVTNGVFGADRTAESVLTALSDAASGFPRHVNI